MLRNQKQLKWTTLTLISCLGEQSSKVSNDEIQLNLHIHQQEKTFLMPNGKLQKLQVQLPPSVFLIHSHSSHGVKPESTIIAVNYHKKKNLK